MYSILFGGPGVGPQGGVGVRGTSGRKGDKWENGGQVGEVYKWERDEGERKKRRQVRQRGVDDREGDKCERDETKEWKGEE